MKLINRIDIIRDLSDASVTLSDFFFDSVKIGVGLEPGSDGLESPLVPIGTYPLGLHYPSRLSEEYYRDSDGYLMLKSTINTDALKAKFDTPHELIWIQNTPDIEYPLFHWGNKEIDTKACYIVGSSKGEIGGVKAVLASRAMYVRIYPIIWNSIKNGSVTVTYSNDGNS